MTEHTNPTQQATRLVETLGSLYDQLNELSRQQRALIESSEMGPLLDLLGKRGALIEQIDGLSGELGDLATGIDPAAPLRSEIANLEQQAEAVARRDAADQSALTEIKESISDELAGMKRGRSAVSAYGTRADGDPPRFQDREA